MTILAKTYYEKKRAIFIKSAKLEKVSCKKYNRHLVKRSSLVKTAYLSTGLTEKQKTKIQNRIHQIENSVLENANLFFYTSPNPDSMETPVSYENLKEYAKDGSFTKMEEGGASDITLYSDLYKASTTGEEGEWVSPDEVTEALDYIAKKVEDEKNKALYGEDLLEDGATKPLEESWEDLQDSQLEAEDDFNDSPYNDYDENEQEFSLGEDDGFGMGGGFGEDGGFGMDEFGGDFQEKSPTKLHENPILDDLLKHEKDNISSSEDLTRSVKELEVLRQEEIAKKETEKVRVREVSDRETILKLHQKMINKSPLLTLYDLESKKEAKFNKRLEPKIKAMEFNLLEELRLAHQDFDVQARKVAYGVIERRYGDFFQKDESSLDDVAIEAFMGILDPQKIKDLRKDGIGVEDGRGQTWFEYFDEDKANSNNQKNPHLASLLGRLKSRILNVINSPEYRPAEEHLTVIQEDPLTGTFAPNAAEDVIALGNGELHSLEDNLSEKQSADLYKQFAKYLWLATQVMEAEDRRGPRRWGGMRSPIYMLYQIRNAAYEVDGIFLEAKDILAFERYLKVVKANHVSAIYRQDKTLNVIKKDYKAHKELPLKEADEYLEGGLAALPERMRRVKQLDKITTKLVQKVVLERSAAIDRIKNSKDEARSLKVNIKNRRNRNIKLVKTYTDEHGKNYQEIEDLDKLADDGLPEGLVMGKLDYRTYSKRFNEIKGFTAELEKVDASIKEDKEAINNIRAGIEKQASSLPREDRIMIASLAETESAFAPYLSRMVIEARRETIKKEAMRVESMVESEFDKAALSLVSDDFEMPEDSLDINSMVSSIVTNEAFGDVNSDVVLVQSQEETKEDGESKMGDTEIEDVLVSLMGDI